MKSNKKFESKALKVLEESSEESSSEDELSLLFKRINQLWKHKQRKFRNYKKPNQRSESSRHRKSSRKEVVCYECKEPGHFKSECPKLQKEKPKKKFDKKKKSLMATWDDSESSESSSKSKDDCANMAFMADTYDGAESSRSELESDSNEVFSELTRSELVDSLTEVLETYNQLRLKYKKLQSKLVSETQHLKNENSEHKERNIKLENDLEKAHELSDSNKSSDITNILNEYDYNFQKFLTRSIDRSKMASMIYGVSRTNRRGIGYEPPSGKGSDHPKSVDEMIIKYTPLYSKFNYGHPHELKYTRTDLCTKVYDKPKVNHNFKVSNIRGPKKIWVPKDKIVHVADVLSCKIKTPVMVPGLWLLTSHDGKKVYVPKPGT